MGEELKSISLCLLDDVNLADPLHLGEFEIRHFRSFLNGPVDWPTLPPNVPPAEAVQYNRNTPGPTVSPGRRRSL